MTVLGAQASGTPDHRPARDPHGRLGGGPRAEGDAQRQHRALGRAAEASAQTTAATRPPLATTSQARRERPARPLRRRARRTPRAPAMPAL